MKEDAAEFEGLARAALGKPKPKRKPVRQQVDLPEAAGGGRGIIVKPGERTDGPYYNPIRDDSPDGGMRIYVKRGDDSLKKKGVR